VARGPVEFRAHAADDIERALAIGPAPGSTKAVIGPQLDMFVN
jgi:hypothetical protein